MWLAKPAALTETEGRSQRWRASIEHVMKKRLLITLLVLAALLLALYGVIFGTGNRTALSPAV